MRTTVTLDPDTELLLRRRIRERGVSFKQALNDALREGLGQPHGGAPFRTPTANLGLPSVSLDRALRVLGELEDEELIRKQRAGK
ncbi:MAG: antitoxin [Acidimicrobiales bacterium]